LLPLAGLALAGGTAAGASVKYAQPVRTGTEHFVLTTRSTATNPTYRAVASGVFKGAGSFTQVASTNTSAKLVAHIAGGRFVVEAATDGTRHISTNSATCRETYTSDGNSYQITDGSGSLQGLHGYGKANIWGTAIAPRKANGKCNFNAPEPVRGTSLTIIQASGPVWLPKHH
jgi:hypothetical protein